MAAGSKRVYGGAVVGRSRLVVAFQLCDLPRWLRVRITATEVCIFMDGCPTELLLGNKYRVAIKGADLAITWYLPR